MTDDEGETLETLRAERDQARAELVGLAAQTRAMARLMVEAGHATPMVTHRFEEMLRVDYHL